ncbi:MAG: hypothetical protein QG594_2590 [Bacteroidota bacterium]|nr:hypothetical protein [Bacteroidota bacterium]
MKKKFGDYLEVSKCTHYICIMEATLQPLKIDRTKLKTVRNYAVLSGVTTTQVYNWIKAKKVKTEKIDGVIFILLE